MNIIAISILTLGIGIILLWIAATTHNFSEGFGIFLAMIGAISTFVCLLFLATKPFDTRATLNTYEVTKTIIQQVDTSEPASVGILETAININSVIETHEYWLSNPWVGLYYSEEIAHLKPIEIKR